MGYCKKKRARLRKRKAKKLLENNTYLDENMGPFGYIPNLYFDEDPEVFDPNEYYWQIIRPTEDRD